MLPHKHRVSFPTGELQIRKKSAHIYTPTQGWGKNSDKGETKGKGKSKSVHAVDIAAAAVSICEARGALAAETAGIALPASDETDAYPKSDTRSWLMDTGCKHDLTTRDATPFCQIGVITQAQFPVLLSTANDLVSSDVVVPQQIGAFGVNAEPYVLDQPPDVLPTGRRCVQDGYSFQWLPHSLAPALKCPNGKVVKLVSRDFCPYLDDCEPKRALDSSTSSCPDTTQREPTTHRRCYLRRQGQYQRRVE